MQLVEVQVDQYYWWI